MRRCPICTRAFPGEELFCPVHGLPLVQERATAEEKVGELTGTVLDERYRLGPVLGSGGMGVVYEAEHLRIGRRCAVKLLHGIGPADPKLRMRFFREVRATSRVRHPNVVEILDFGEHDKAGSYMVMEYLDGTSLDRIVQSEAPLPLDAACSLTVQLCGALAATHAHGLIHRDLKPANVMRLPTGRLKVLDFGLVKPLDKQTCAALPTLTTDGVIMGTPWYMSPEHFQGAILDARADIYSLGVVLYEMLTGRPPFDGTTPAELVKGHLYNQVPLPQTLNPPIRLPATLELILLKALSKKRDERYQSMIELADAIYFFADEQGLSLAEGGVKLRGGEASAICETRDTLKWAGSPAPLSSSAPPLFDLQKLALAKEKELVESIVETLRSVFPRYRAIDQQSLVARVARVVHAGVQVIGKDPEESIAAQFPDIDAPEDQLSLTEAITALWLSYATARPLVIEAAGNQMDRFVELSAQFDQRLLPFFFHAVDTYVSSYQGKLQRLNETLARHNDELQALRASLADQVDQTSHKLADAEKLKARVTESVSAGMLLVERGSARVLLWNAAMERLSGVDAGQVLGRALFDITHIVDGVPFSEFADQIRYQQEVGLRKLRITFLGKDQRTVYVKGQPFFSSAGELVGTLFVVEDVTEREQIIESLGRYLSKDLVDRILAREGPPEPEGERRSAVLLAAKINGLREFVEQQSAQGVVRLLSNYVRAVARTIFRRGGTIERINPDGMLAYFARLGSSPQSAIEAAVELAQRVSQMNKDRSEGAATIDVTIGLHIGELLILNVGGEPLMVQTVVGQATHTVEALVAAGGPGEILLSSELAALAGPEVALDKGPEVALTQTTPPQRTSKVIYEPNPQDLEGDPPTLVR